MKACLQCGAIAKYRGLCFRHYRTTSNRVSRGQTTYEIEMAAGRIGPPMGRKTIRMPKARPA